MVLSGLKAKRDDPPELLVSKILKQKKKISLPHLVVLTRVVFTEPVVSFFQQKNLVTRVRKVSKK